MDTLYFTFNLFFLIISFIILFLLQKYNISFSLRSLIALLLGIGIGIFINYTQSDLLKNKGLEFYSLEIFRVFAAIYINLLKSMVYPLIVVAILTALTKIDNGKELSKYGIYIIAFLLLGTAIASFISIIVMFFFNLTNGISFPTSSIVDMTNNYQSKANTNIADVIINFVPINPFLDLTGARRSSTVATVIFLILVGVSYLWVKNNYKEEGEFFKNLVNSLYRIIMRVVTIILRLTPYGILALIAKVIAETNLSSIISLVYFIICTFVAIFIMFVVQTIAIYLFGFNPITYYKKMFPLLSFSFFSRSSAASIPLGVDIQTNKLGINPSIANLSTSLGATIGQAGCVGVYGTMVIFLTAASIGVNPWSLHFILYVIFIITVTSLGVAGIGGGAVYGAIIALSAFNYPLTIIGVLIPIEAILDMARTMLNVNGLTVSGLLTSKITRSNNSIVYNNTSNKSNT